MDNDNKPETNLEITDSKSIIIPQQPINGQPSGLPIPKPKRLKKHHWRIIALAGLVLAVFAGVFIWYNVQLRPLSDDKNNLKVVNIVSGTNPTTIGQLLQDEGVIRNSFVFDVYTRLSSNRSNLQAGRYRLSPSESVQSIVGHLTKGNVDQFNITFLPGATLAQNRKVLLGAGFTDQEIDEAFATRYNSPLFEGKPASSDLEGYIYGETYQFNVASSVEDILKYTFDQYYKDIQDNDLLSGFERQGLNLFQAITLASIVQREVSNPDDVAKVAQVFYSRYRQGIKLGSDVTYQYIADRLGVARDTNLDSPYNTRRYAGLPPGPIATPGLGALRAVAYPADTKYLFFLSGDDDVTYFSYTDAEHQANRVNYCQDKCSEL